MIRLRRSRETRVLDVGFGVRLTVRPLTTAIHRSARYSAEAAAVEAARLDGVIEQAGGRIADIPDITVRAGYLGLVEQFMLQALAVHAVEGWEGVGDDSGAPAALEPRAIQALIRDFPLIAAAFERSYLAEMMETVAEGEGCGAAPSGFSAAAPSTAADAATTPDLATTAQQN